MRTSLLVLCLLVTACAPAAPRAPGPTADTAPTTAHEPAVEREEPGAEAPAAPADPATAENVTEEKVMKTQSEWRQILSPEQFRILREKGTERAFTGEYDHVFDKGTYRCVGCDQVLFHSDHKYDSGCGWPAFWKPANDTAVTEHADRSFGMVRTEVVCSKCDGHLGHVFDDGPEPTGLRYCINSACLKLIPFEEAAPEAD